MPRDLTVADVRAVLEPKGLHVQELPDDTSTAPLAAAALGVPVGAIAKSLLFMAGDHPILALVSGDRTADLVRLAALADVEAVRLARPSEVLRITGYRVGGVPPVAHRISLPVYLDRDLQRFDTVFAAAGGPHAVFAVSPGRLSDLTGGTWAALAV